MSRDGYCGQGVVGLLNPVTLAAVEKVLRERGEISAANAVKGLYDETRAELDKYIRNSKVHG